MIRSEKNKIDDTSKLMYSKDAMQIYDYSTSGGKNLILEYIKDLPDALKAEILDTRQLIREKGIDAFLLLTTRQLYKKLWEIKISQERIMYVIQDQESVYFLNICKKQKNRNWRKLRNVLKKPACYKGVGQDKWHLLKQI